MQLPSPPPDPNILIPQIIPIFGMFTGLVITGFVVLGPVGRAIGRVIQHVFGAGKEPSALPSAEVEELREQLEGMRGQLAELAERQEFTERMLAQARRDRALPGGQDVVG
jgi:hypothetical protein